MDTTMTTAAPTRALTTAMDDASSLVTTGHRVAGAATSELMRTRTAVAPTAPVSSTWRAASVAGTGVPAAGVAVIAAAATRQAFAAIKDHANVKPAGPPRGSTG